MPREVNIPKEFDITAKYLAWEMWEAVPLPLFGDKLGGLLQVNDPAYFEPTRFNKDDNDKIRRLTKIQITPGAEIGELGLPTKFNGMSVVPYSVLNAFTLTLVSLDGKTTHRQIPLMDLTNAPVALPAKSQNAGKIRIFDCFPDLTKSFVLNLNAPWALPNCCILFNFHFVSW